MNAKELFEQLGYSVTVSPRGNHNELVYFKKNTDPKQGWDYYVRFNLENETFKITDDWGDSYFADVPLLQAIVYQIKELRWL
jgi:hypothetical protein